MSIRVSTFIAGLSVLAGLLLILAPFVVEPPAGTNANILRTAGAVVIAIGLWATGAFPPYFTSILFLFVSIALSLAPPKVIFSGFSSSAVWLVFGGLVLGVAVHKTGLGRRAVSLMLRHFPVSYRGTIWAIVLVGAVLAFFIPSAVGRVMLLVPIVLALADRLGFEVNSKGRTGMVLAAGMGTMIPAFSILPSNVPNMGLIGASESVYGITYTYGEYFVLNYPVMGTFAIVAMALLICRMFPDKPSRSASEDAATPWSAAERRLMFVLALALGLWVTDFLHGIAPAWIALGAAILCLLPVVGVLPPNALARDIDYGPWFFVAGIIGLGAIVTETGLGSRHREGAVLGDTARAGHGRPNLRIAFRRRPDRRHLYDIAGLAGHHDPAGRRYRGSNRLANQEHPPDPGPDLDHLSDPVSGAAHRRHPRPGRCRNPSRVAAASGLRHHRDRRYAAIAVSVGPLVGRLSVAGRWAGKGR